MAGELVRGLDASSAQGALPIDALVKAGYEFVVLKAQQGNDGFDPAFAGNLAGAVAADLVVSPYCFVYPLAHLDPVEEAKRFVAALAPFPAMQGRRIMLDCEWPPTVAPGQKGWREWGSSPAQISDWLRRHAEALTAEAGCTPALYTYDYWWEAVRTGALGMPGADVCWAAAYDLWMAWYVKNAPKPGDAPRIPTPWTDWRLWQWDGNGGARMPNGVDADFVVYNGTIDSLRAWALGLHV